MSNEPLPWERRAAEVSVDEPGLLVDLERCIGCHACSVACKTAHRVPLGTFRMRVRWLPRPDRDQLAFVPLFDAEQCDLGENARAYGMAPECVRACPTAALVYGDRADPEGELVRAEREREAKPFESAAATHPDVRYAGQEPWMGEAVGAGVPLSPEDPDITYEQPAPGEAARRANDGRSHPT